MGVAVGAEGAAVHGVVVTFVEIGGRDGDWAGDGGGKGEEQDGCD